MCGYIQFAGSPGTFSSAWENMRKVFDQFYSTHALDADLDYKNIPKGKTKKLRTKKNVIVIP